MLILGDKAALHASRVFHTNRIEVVVVRVIETDFCVFKRALTVGVTSQVAASHHGTSGLYIDFIEDTRR